MLITTKETDEYYFEEGCYILELSNSECDDAVSIARARVEAGQCTKWHSLIDTVERYVIVSGSGRVEVGQEEAKIVNTGDVVLISAGLRQRIHNTGDEDLVFMAICTPRFLKENYRSLE